MNERLKTLVESALDELKAVNPTVISLAGKTDWADYIIIATGTSDRHLHAMAAKIVEKCKETGESILGIEGEQSRDWVLVDLGDVVVHLMREETRELYALEKLWTLPPARQSH
ncbi:MAG: ribosome silencing factor [Cardiobacteriaceae bacterium]|nr:ribosome silencing factor [Cardiobacteriaceae bacterium]